MKTVTLYKSDFTDLAWSELMKELEQEGMIIHASEVSSVTLSVAKACLTFKEK